jgi:hypothetical protein
MTQDPCPFVVQEVVTRSLPKVDIVRHLRCKAMAIAAAAAAAEAAATAARQPVDQWSPFTTRDEATDVVVQRRFRLTFSGMPSDTNSVIHTSRTGL